MKIIKWVTLMIFITLSSEAKDLLPHSMEIQKGHIQSSTELDLTAIDNQALSLQPSKNGDFKSSFIFKNKGMNGEPYLDIRISFQTGSYEFQVLKGKKWKTLGSIQGKNKWQRVKLYFQGSFQRLRKNQKHLKIRIIGKNKPSIAQLDYMGVSVDADIAQAK